MFEQDAVDFDPFAVIMEDGGAPYRARICRCGLIESKIAWAHGGRGCPCCKRVWPENLCAWNMRGHDPTTPFVWTPPVVIAQPFVERELREKEAELDQALIYINRLRDQLAVAQMKNTLVSDVLRAAAACVGCRDARHYLPLHGELALRLHVWVKAGKPGLIDE